MKTGVSATSALISPGALEALSLAIARMAGEIAAEIVAERLRDAGAPRYATSKQNPMGSGERFLAAARRGEFRSFRDGKEVKALWTDVEAAIESKPPTRRRQEQANLEAQLQQAATPRRRRA